LLPFKTIIELSPRNYYNDIAHVREFFEEVAKERGINPLDPYAWYAMRLIDMDSKKVSYLSLSLSLSLSLMIVSLLDEGCKGYT